MNPVLYAPTESATVLRRYVASGGEANSQCRKKPGGARSLAKTPDEMDDGPVASSTPSAWETNPLPVAFSWRNTWPPGFAAAPSPLNEI